MKNILYLGNQLKPRGLNPTTIDVLGEKLARQHKVKCSSKKSNQVLRALDMLWSIFKNRSWAEVVLIDTYSTLAFNFAWLNSFFCRRFNLPYIILLHGGNLPQRFNKSRIRSISMLNNAYRIVSPSHYLKDVTMDMLALQVDMIPNFIELSNYPFYYNRDVSETKLLWVRAFQDIYNPVMAIEVLNLIHKSGQVATLTMVGGAKDGSRIECENLAKELGLSDFIRFTGQLDKPTWIDLSKDHNVFINTSKVDNTPITLIEAMALGIPVVSTNVGGISHLIEHGQNGLLVAENDTHAMMREIQNIISNDSLREKLVRNGYQLAQSFNWPEVEKSWNVILDL